MRLTGLRAAGALLLALVASALGLAQFAVNARASLLSADATVIDLIVPANHEHSALIAPGDPAGGGLTRGYWGWLYKPTGATTVMKWGSYRATCVWLAKLGSLDTRTMCTVVLGRGFPRANGHKPKGGSLVAQGLVTLPQVNAGLFAAPSARKLAITGGTGPYNGSRGRMTIRGGSITISLCSDDLSPCATEPE